MITDELQGFFATWDREAGRTAQLLRALPADQVDFRPDPQGRSLGELAWHIAEAEARVSTYVAEGRMQPGKPMPGLERPRTVAEIAAGYERLHAEARARLSHLTAADLSRTMTFFDGSEQSLSFVLWNSILYHHIHHRGQLTVLCRLAGGVPDGLYGPNREAMAAMRAARGGA